MKINGRGIEYGVCHVVADVKESIVLLIERTCGLGSQEARELVELGAVYLNDRRVVSEGLEVKSGDRVRIHTDPRRFSRPIDLASRVVYENSDFLLANKPPGIPTHALTDNKLENLITFLEEFRKEKLYITHRLDIETSGLVILARTKEAQQKLNDDIKARSIKRIYCAYVEKPVPPGEYVHFMCPSPKAPKTVSRLESAGWLKCSLHVLNCSQANAAEARQNTGCLPSFASIFKLEIELETGRSQQIRAQLAELGAPIIGDKNYGGSNCAVGSLNRAIGLQAYALVIGDRKFFVPRSAEAGF